MNMEYKQEKPLNTHYTFTLMTPNKEWKQLRVLVYTGIINIIRTRRNSIRNHANKLKTGNSGNMNREHGKILSSRGVIPKVGKESIIHRKLRPQTEGRTAGLRYQGSADQGGAGGSEDKGGSGGKQEPSGAKGV